MRDDKSIIPLVEKLKDSNADLREQAAEALERIGDIRAAPGLRDALDDKVARVRGNVTTALGSIGDLEAVPLLVKRLKDPSSNVRLRAAGALEKINDPKAAPALMHVLKKHKELQVRICAAHALGNMEHIEAVPTVLESIHEGGFLDDIPCMEMIGKQAIGDIWDKCNNLESIYEFEKKLQEGFDAIQNKDGILDVPSARKNFAELIEKRKDMVKRDLILSGTVKPPKIKDSTKKKKLLNYEI